jgi:hypothetical protein
MNKPKYPTDQELAAAVEKVTVAVRESIPKLKAAIPVLLPEFSDEEWAKIKQDEDCRRRGMHAASEWDPNTKWEGVEHPSRYWRGCEARLQRKRGVDPEDALCRFPNCDELGCLRHLPEWERETLKCIDAERKAESKRYKEAWMRKAGLIND